MRKIFLIFVAFLIGISVSNSQSNDIHTLDPSGLIPDPQSMLYNQFQQNYPDFFKVVGEAQQAYGIIADPVGFGQSQLISQLSPEYQQLFQEVGYVKNYVEQSKKVEDYKLDLNDNGAITKGLIVYKVEGGRLNNVKANLAGVKKEKDKGKFSCADTKDNPCTLTLEDSEGRKNSYLNIDPKSSKFELDEAGSLIYSDFTVTKETDMFFGDRAYKIQPGTRLQYYSRVDEQGNEFYEVEVNSKSKQGISFSFPELDEKGKPIAGSDKNYEISGGYVTFTEDGAEIYDNAVLVDKKLGYEVKNNGKNMIFLTNKENKIIGKTNYILSNNDKFKFNLEKSSILFYKNNPWSDISGNEKLGIEVSGFGSGIVENDQITGLEGSFSILNCESKETLTQRDIIQEKYGDKCVPIKLISGDGKFIEDSEGNIQVCSFSTPTGKTTYFSKILGMFYKVTGKGFVTQLPKDGSLINLPLKIDRGYCNNGIYEYSKSIGLFDGNCVDKTKYSNLIIPNLGTCTIIQIKITSVSQSIYLIKYNNKFRLTDKAVINQNGKITLPKDSGSSIYCFEGSNSPIKPEPGCNISGIKKSGNPQLKNDPTKKPLICPGKCTEEDKKNICSGHKGEMWQSSGGRGYCA